MSARTKVETAIFGSPVPASPDGDGGERHRRLATRVRAICVLLLSLAAIGVVVHMDIHSALRLLIAGALPLAIYFLALAYVIYLSPLIGLLMLNVVVRLLRRWMRRADFDPASRAGTRAVAWLQQAEAHIVRLAARREAGRKAPAMPIDPPGAVSARNEGA